MWKDGNSRFMRLPWLTLLAGAAALLLFIGPVEWSLGLQLDRSDWGIRTVWQSITGHLTHWNGNHLAWDLAVFGMVGAFVEIRSRRVLLRLILLSGAAISLAVLAWLPEIQYYRGLSGVDMALVGYWLCVQLKESRSVRRWMWGIGLALSVAKPLVEIILGEAMFVTDLGAGVSNVPLAHLVGAGVGVAIACADRRAGNRTRVA